MGCLLLSVWVAVLVWTMLDRGTEPTLLYLLATCWIPAMAAYIFAQEDGDRVERTEELRRLSERANRKDQEQ